MRLLAKIVLSLVSLFWLAIVIWLIADLSITVSEVEASERFAVARGPLLLLTAAVGAPFVIWRAILADRQTNAQQSQVLLAAKRDVADQILAAISLLDKNTIDGAPSFYQRSAGIQVLVTAANSSESDYDSIMNLVSTYVKQNVDDDPIPWPPRPRVADIPRFQNDKGFEQELVAAGLLKGKFIPDWKANSHDAPSRRADIQAALSALSERNDESRRFEQNLHQKTGRFIVDLSSSMLRRANLSNMNMGAVNMRLAQLQGADLRRADFSGSDFVNADLTGADLREAILDGCDFSGARFEKTKIVGAKSRGSRFHQTEFADISFRDVDCEGSDFSSAFFAGGTFSEGKFGMCNFRSTDLRGFHFSDADLSDCVFMGCDLRLAWLENANLQGSFLSGARLTGARKLVQQQLDVALARPIPEMIPDTLTEPDHWADERWCKILTYEAWYSWRKDRGLKPIFVEKDKIETI